ncbi:hypothetical protein GCM10018980_08140 [Streptomyces capoamus]|uniref:Uncharacterized protein n=1 Tax=Streptomyces capoamus TaxID=68183 RepID=A0A919EVA5_9ACTN|nr:hypothetical protein [Streptomyces capoamus]GGW17380.1 hypothetical protein GCM10010501_37680 [Streptomyces libani subsp. rufus]GHG36938.1 hypothetical protein GCM10018980_08140 [Streptomyces capoamus]
MSPRAGQAGHPARTLAFVESPVQLLNVLEWAHLHGLPDHPPSRPATGAPAGAGPNGTASASPPAGPAPALPEAGPVLPAQAGPVSACVSAPPAQTRGSTVGAAARGAVAGGAVAGGAEFTVVVLAPTDPMTRGQLRRMADLARDEGYRVRWEEARGGTTAPFHTIGGLAGLLRRAGRIVMGDPFSRYVQLLLTITRARDLVVVDDGTATMEFVAQLARGERLVRWHRKGGRPGARDLLFAPVSSSARRRLTPSGGRRVEVFSSMPVTETPEGVTVTANDFAWTRARFGPPRITDGADMVGTSLVETGVVDGERYLAAVRDLARAHGVTRYFAHRRENTGKLHRLAVETGLEIVRPDLPLELIARRGPIGRTVLSFPSTVVHTLPLALAGTGVRVAVCDIDPAWLTATASPRAQGFLSGVTGTARDVHRLTAVAPA